MTETTNLPVRPAPLREVLEAGGKPEDILGDNMFQILWERAIDAATDGPEGRGRKASLDDAQVEASVAGEVLTTAVAGQPGMTHDWPPMNQEHVTCSAWGAELLRDPSLVPLLAASTRDPLRWSSEIDCARRPYPLVVGPPHLPHEHASISCEGCGALLAGDDPCMTIGHREGWSDDRSEMRGWCQRCVMVALFEIDRAQIKRELSKIKDGASTDSAENIAKRMETYPVDIVEMSRARHSNPR